MLMSDDDSKQYRRSDCSAAGDAGSADTKNARAGTVSWQGVARSILRQSEKVLFVDHGSLYLALQRLEDKKWISAKWGVSENNRKARFYSLTAKGRERLIEKTSEWDRLTRAMELVLQGRGGLSGEEA